MLSWLLLLVT